MREYLLLDEGVGLAWYRALLGRAVKECFADHPRNWGLGTFLGRDQLPPIWQRVFTHTVLWALRTLLHFCLKGSLRSSRAAVRYRTLHYTKFGHRKNVWAREPDCTFCFRRHMRVWGFQGNAGPFTWQSWAQQECFFRFHARHPHEGPQDHLSVQKHSALGSLRGLSALGAFRNPLLRITSRNLLLEGAFRNFILRKITLRTLWQRPGGLVRPHFPVTRPVLEGVIKT